MLGLPRNLREQLHGCYERETRKDAFGPLLSPYLDGRYPGDRWVLRSVHFPECPLPYAAEELELAQSGVGDDQKRQIPRTNLSQVAASHDSIWMERID